MEKTNTLYSVKLKLKNCEEYLIGFNTLVEAQNLLVRLEEDTDVIDSKIITK